MSEYQYYEFLAIDRPLTAQETDYLRSLSSRAHITPASFTNEYHWGDFKGNPRELMRRFFDVHVYIANWGTAVFMVRLPLAALDRKAADAFAVDDVVEVESTASHRVICWGMNEGDDYDRFEVDDGAGWMARLAPVREELLRGDLRSLYIGWLAAVSIGAVEGDEQEPPALEGLDRLTAAQQALAELLGVNEDLLAGVGLDRPAGQDSAAESRRLEAWLSGLSREEALPLIQQLLSGQGQQAEREVKSRFAAWRRDTEGPSREIPRRTVNELWDLAEKAKGIRLLREKREQEEAEAKRQKERETYLAALAKDFTKAWKAVCRQVEVGSGRAYDEACRALVDLSEAYGRHGDRHAFEQEMRRFIETNGRRKALVERLVKAGLWQK
jgi:hypothetical protein